MQSRRHSIIEAMVNVSSGMLIAFIISQLAHVYEHWIQLHIWNGFKWNINAAGNFIMTSILTIVSVIRGYIWRRYFNRRIKHEPRN